MNLTSLAESQSAIGQAAFKGMQSFARPEPMRASQWADEHFYLSAETSYAEGRWETLSFQRGIMDTMANDDVREVWVLKAARVGFTKCLLAVTQYLAEHKLRNTAIWLPNDDSRDQFVKQEVNTSIRDNPAIRAIFPDFDNNKSPRNTTRLKQFIGSSLHLLGGKAAKNYRAISVDTGIIDELDGFDNNIEREGPPTQLAQRRVQGAAFPKFVAGSTPKLRRTSMIEPGEAECEARLRWHVACPHCEHEQHVRWGGRDDEFGIKWEKTEQGELDVESIAYQCESCGEQFNFEQYLQQAQKTGRWRTLDGSVYLDEKSRFRNGEGELIDAPMTVGFHIWTGIGELVDWTTIVREWLTCQGKKEKLQGFVNLTLGEGFETDETEQLDAHIMHRTRRSHYAAEVPEGVTVVTCGIDHQDDRFELQYDGWGPDEERWSLAYDVIHGDLSRPVVWDHLAKALRRQFRKAGGETFEPLLCCIDYGGHFGDEVANLSKRLGPLFLIPTKGSNQYGKAIVNFPRTKNAKGIYLVEVGTDTAKDLLWQRIAIDDPGPGYWHWPVAEDFDETYFAQLTAEHRVRKLSRGKELFVWESGGRRNEAWDCSVLNLVAVRIAQQKFGLDLNQASRSAQRPPQPKAKTKRRKARSDFWG